ncbi:zinc-binding dehydrogenase [Dehalogenimonas etheniformans]|uniref:Alcohol dehydrogenase n=1 Tax=Dehalogenimonas etheniformans TaxID=1536648 RepID=A0A2P5P859_9CHLR|nr:alcohol dehydrogenase [Dehalogenimonas etheniformans]QNT76761.1 zinc-binding dehydrogenase [Dehalogenimonas etheniformans]
MSEVGSSTGDLKIGDRVGIGWLGRPCGRCEWCSKGQEQLCMDIVQAATWLPYGGFSSSVVANSRFANLLPRSMSSEVAAVMMCAGITVYSPLIARVSQLPLNIGIIGMGGLGHLAIQFAHAMGYEVTAISSSPDKKKQAFSFGADHFLDLNDRTALRQRQYAFDFLFCTAHGNFKWEPLLEILKKRGTIVMIGFPNVSLNSTDLVAHELTITGSFLGSRLVMREMLAFAAEHNIEPLIQSMPMSLINKAIEIVRQNKARYRIVLYNDLLPNSKA